MNSSQLDADALPRRLQIPLPKRSNTNEVILFATFTGRLSITLFILHQRTALWDLEATSSTLTFLILHRWQALLILVGLWLCLGCSLRLCLPVARVSSTWGTCRARRALCTWRHLWRSWAAKCSDDIGGRDRNREVFGWLLVSTVDLVLDGYVLRLRDMSSKNGDYLRGR